MIARAVTYLNHHAIATTAFVCSLLALAGASYAAASLPANSVGAKQVQNHSITPVKLSNVVGAFGGYVRDWALINGSGKVVASNRPAITQVLMSFFPVEIGWKDKFSSGCVPLVTVEATTKPPYSGTRYYAMARNEGGGGVTVTVYKSATQPVKAPFYVVIVC